VSTEPLTLEEHRELGEEIQKTRKHLLQLSRMLLEVYGPNNRCAFACEKLNEAVVQLTQELAKQAVADCPGEEADRLYR
jgi:hypothetical protein